MFTKIRCMQKPVYWLRVFVITQSNNACCDLKMYYTGVLYIISLSLNSNRMFRSMNSPCNVILINKKYRWTLCQKLVFMVDYCLNFWFISLQSSNNDSVTITIMLFINFLTVSMEKAFLHISLKNQFFK